MINDFTLVDALINRRSRRFGNGFHMTGGPLAYKSMRQVQPLSLEEEATLAFSGSGITGPILGDFPYRDGNAANAGWGNVLNSFVGRTIGSPDSMHTVSLIVVNDDGAWLIRRPQDFSPADLPGVIRAGQERNFVDAYQACRVKIADKRVQFPRDDWSMMPFNTWASNLPGTTYFLPINDLTPLYLNFILMLFSEGLNSYLIDERNNLQPAGIKAFAKSRGGMLYDDPGKGRITTVGMLEDLVLEFVAIEQGMMLQNIALTSEALGLGGFPHYAAHPFRWCEALGFRMEDVDYLKSVGTGPVFRGILKMMGRRPTIKNPVGLERGGEVLLKPFCPPYYRNMEEAVLAFVDSKYSQRPSRLEAAGATTAWKNAEAVDSAIPRYSDSAIAATIAYCNYIYKRYGRFPSSIAPFRTALAHQVHRVDPEFYATFYRQEGAGQTQR